MANTTDTERPSGPIAGLGRLAIAVGRDTVAIIRLLTVSLESPRQIDRHEVFLQAHQMANRSVAFVGVIMAFTGFIMVHHAAAQSLRVVGDLSIVGPAYINLLCREFGPIIVAMMIAARYGAGVAAEVGAMQITEQIDALRMAGADVETHIVGPRVLGGLIGMLPIVVLGGAVAWFTGALAARHDFAIGPDMYFSYHLVEWHDVLTGVVKALAFGVAIPLVSAYAGLSAKGGAPGVGRATTWAVIGSSVAVVLLDFGIGTLGYVLFRT
jgi:phospholipid/cholesterol/gamma-HCH transport system permease protein